jgi:hypothetical protein
LCSLSFSSLHSSSLLFSSMSHQTRSQFSPLHPVQPHSCTRYTIFWPRVEKLCFDQHIFLVHMMNCRCSLTNHQTVYPVEGNALLCEGWARV